MDFTFSENQLMVQDLARGILNKEVSADRVKQIERGADWFDQPLWATLAEAGLLGLVVPEDSGGMGFGIEEACILLQEVGRVVAPVPVYATLVLGGLPIAQFGTAAQKKAWLEPMAAGEAILSGALVDAGSSDPAAPATTARQDGKAWVLTGQKLHVPAAHLAKRILVPAKTPGGVGIFLVDPQAKGITLTRNQTSSGEIVCAVNLADVKVDAGDLLGDDAAGGAATATWMYERALAALCATQVGVSERSLEMTAAYVRERIQFGVPIGSFQAVQHRAADCYIDLESMRWTTWRAAWVLGQGQPGLRETAVAKFCAAESGSRIANAAIHLHAGMGVDVDYPLFRYFLWTKALELSLGAATPQLARLGRDMARTGVQELRG